MEAGTPLLSPSPHRPWVSLCSVVDLLCAHRALQSKHWCAGDVSCESSPLLLMRKPTDSKLEMDKEWLLGFSFPCTAEPGSLAAKIMSLNIIPLAL